MTDLDVRGAASGTRAPSRALAAVTDPVHPAAAAHTLARRSNDVVAVLASVDALAVALALTLAYWGRFGAVPVEIGRADQSVSAVVVSVLIGLAWLVCIAAQRAYEPRFLGVGGEEYRRVTRATFVLFGALAVGSYVVKFELARGFVALVFPMGLAFLLVGRFAARQWLIRARTAGRLCHRVLVLGDRGPVREFVEQVRLEPRAGFVVVGACLPRQGERLRESDGIVTLGTYADVARVVREAETDVVAVTASESMTPDRLRRLAWSLEGLDVDLVVAPAVTDVAGPRLSVRPVAGLPLLYVDEPRFTGWQRLIKGSLDRVGALVGLILLAPLLLLVGVAVRLTSHGPALFRQERVGLDGRTFRCLKFRTMVVDAESRLTELGGLNEGDGLLFKIAADPRVTALGRLLRSTSIDELPQLINVLRGEMSLVGPRPLAVDSEAFADDEHRRHLVKPGITGLWQVSGRQEQSWDDAVRLDLYYVENWSLAMDLVILLRTAVAVFRGR